MEPVAGFRRQGQAHKGKGAGSQAAYDGAYTSESYIAGNAPGPIVDIPAVSAVAGSRIRVLSYSASAGAASTITFNTKPAGAGTAITPLISLAANGTMAESDNNGLFQTAVGEGLSLTTGANTVGLRFTYIVVQ